MKKGYLPFERFRKPALFGKYPEERLFYIVPENTGGAGKPALLLFLHGGAVTKDNPDFYLKRDDHGFSLHSSGG